MEGNKPIYTPYLISHKLKLCRKLAAWLFYVLSISGDGFVVRFKASYV